MSEIQKCPNLVKGGVSIFQICLKFKNVLIGTFSQIFLIFYFDASPNQISTVEYNKQYVHDLASQ